jgi:hypothetical protein
MTEVTQPNNKRIRILTPPGKGRKEEPPDIDDVLPPQSRQSNKAQQRKETPAASVTTKPATKKSKVPVERENRPEMLEPSITIRRRFDEEDDNGDREHLVDMKEMFKQKPSKKNEKEKLPNAQGVAVGDMDMPDVGISYPSFCLEMLTGSSVLPLSSCYILAGPTNSFKSHFAFEIARWIASINGIVALAENEVKYNRDMPPAVMGRTLGEQVWIYECQTFNQVESSLVDGIDRRDKYETTVPMMQIVDSIVGNSTASNAKKLRDSGEIERGYPANALAAANFLPSYLPMLSQKPYLGLWVTHSKDVEKQCGPFTQTITTLKGGGSWESRCRVALVLRRISDMPKYEDMTWIVRLKLQLKKDMSVRGFQLPFNVRCAHDVIYDKESGEYFSERKLRFCWDEATLNLWLAPEKAGYPPYYKTIIKDITGFNQVKMSGRNVFIAPKIGIGKEEATKDCRKIMDALYSNSSILDRLRAELGIKKGVGMRQGDSFDSLIEKARTIAIRRAAIMKAKNNITYIRRADIREDES